MANTNQRVAGPKSLMAEINALEQRIQSMGKTGGCENMSWMGDDLDAVDFDDVELGDAVPAEVMDEGLFMDDEDEDLGFDEEFMDMPESPEFCSRAGSRKNASERAPGIEDEINDDYLSELAKLTGKESLDTDPSMLDAARTASQGEIVRLKSAVARLDRVANHLEKNGRNKLAFRIDQISDAVDARINGGK